MNPELENLKIQKWLCALSVGLFVLKIIAWYLTHSVSILADALESIANVVAGFIGLYSLFIAAKPKDVEHPYGHGKAEFISAAAEGLMILCAGLLIIYRAIAEYNLHSEVTHLDSGLYLVLATGILNYAFGWYCIHKGRQNNSLALQSSGKHLQLDTYSTVAIIIGLLFVMWFHLYWLDKLIALVLGLFIVYNGYKILRKSLAGIMDEADMSILTELVSIMNAHRTPDWIDIHNLRVVKYGSLLHIDCHFTLPYYMTVQKAHDESSKMQQLVRENFPERMEFNVHTDPCRPISCSICTIMDCPVRSSPFVKRLDWTLDRVLSVKQHNAKKD